MNTDYDRFAWIYSRHWGHFSNRILPLLKEHLLSHLPESARILDLCCGTGHLAKALTEKGHQVTGLDYSEEMLRYARENAPQAEFILTDARDFSLEETFHAAVSTYDSLNHILSIEELKKVFQNVYQSLKPGGRFYFDLNTEAKFKSTWPRSFSIVRDEYVCAARTHFHEEKELAEFLLTLFTPEGDHWERQDHSITLKGYAKEDVIEALEEAGFVNTRVFSEHIEEQGKTGRKLFLCEKPDGKRE